MWAKIVWNKYSSEDQVQIQKGIMSRDNNRNIGDTWYRTEIVTQLGIRTIILTNLTLMTHGYSLFGSIYRFDLRTYQ